MTAGSKSEQPEWPLGDWFVDRASPADLIAYERREVLVRGRTPFQQYGGLQERPLGPGAYPGRAAAVGGTR